MLQRVVVASSLQSRTQPPTQRLAPSLSAASRRPSQIATPPQAPAVLVTNTQLHRRCALCASSHMGMDEVDRAAPPADVLSSNRGVAAAVCHTAALLQYKRCVCGGVGGWVCDCESCERGGANGSERHGDGGGESSTCWSASSSRSRSHTSASTNSRLADGEAKGAGGGGFPAGLFAASQDSPCRGEFAACGCAGKLHLPAAASVVAIAAPSPFRPAAAAAAIFASRAVAASATEACAAASSAAAAAARRASSRSALAVAERRRSVRRRSSAVLCASFSHASA
eukprot:scaffold2668_cov115-Isochrysis_galbana.AAC.9